MYSTYNEGNSVVAERFIRTLKNKLYKHMTATGKNVYYDVLDDVVNEYNNTKHNTIKMKPKMLKMIIIEYILMSIIKKVLDIMWVTGLEYLNLKIYLPKDILLIGVEKYLLLIK